MRNIPIMTLFAITLICNSLYAETVKSTKSIKSSEQNTTMTNDEFMKEFMKLDKQEKDSEKKLEKTIKLRKTVDELGKQLGIDKQK